MATHLDLATLHPDETFTVDLGGGLWLMDNHKWALLAWERSRTASRFELVHADFHWDGVDDFAGDEGSQAALMSASTNDLEAMTAADRYIRFDSFIAAAVRRGLLSRVHFFCLEDEGSDEGLDESLCEKFGVQQVVHRDIKSLAAIEPAHPVIFDLCLDLFNRSNDLEYEGDLWSDDEVIAFIEAMAQHITAADVVTVSLSFGYSGTEVDTRHLAELVIPRIQSLRTQA